MTETSIEAALARIQAQLHLDREREHDVLEEIRTHLEEAVAEAQASGLGEAEALAQAVRAFGVDAAAGKLHAVHVGWATADGVLAAGLPVLCALVLRWLVFAPDGTTLGWPELLIRPAFWVMAAIALAVPWLNFRRWRYALAMWTVFWGITLATLVFPGQRW